MTDLNDLKNTYRLAPDSPGLRSGAILMSSGQYDHKVKQLQQAYKYTDQKHLVDQLIEAWHDMWEPIRVSAIDIMYRYKEATIPWTGRVYVPGEEIAEPEDEMDKWWNQHHKLADEFSNQLQVATTGTFLIEGDEDDDFTYGAFLQGIANLGMHADQWLLTHEFGNYYSVRHIDTVLKN